MTFLLLTAVSPALGCFGPKLYFGVSPGPEAEILYQLCALYVKEKTGTESVRVDVATGEGLALLGDDKLDLVLVEGSDGEEDLLRLAPFPALRAGKRPRDDLQFTTVLPALHKLAGLLRREDVAALLARVAAGEASAAAARAFLTDRGWI
ncbi:hypothetical protein [Desulfuromonas soudanensis]|uniref:hypothetical protein n=1 Tax=Desulfuromonas soudanensis TaxID=1603606 RepID=UPI0006AD4600|nr:hypothetical protein [Desulfuromonas soudanensis]